MNGELESLQSGLDATASRFNQVLADYQSQLHPQEVGTIQSISSGIAIVTGLPNVKADELLQFPGKTLGLALNLDPDEIGVILLGSSENIEAGDKVYRTGRVMDVPVGEALLGRVVNGVGDPLDEAGEIASTERHPIERESPSIMARSPVTVPLQTGLKVVDALVPIGRGQRELIVGDRQTEKLRSQWIQF
jgi:F-type H+-transporting ATPase subunit alpha